MFKKVLTLAAAALLALPALAAGARKQKLPLVELGAGFDRADIRTRHAQVEPQDGSLVVRYGHRTRWPTVIFSLPEAKQDLSAYRRIAVDVYNPTDRRFKVSCRVDNPGADGQKNCRTENRPVEPGRETTIYVRLPHPSVIAGPEVELIGMRGKPTEPELDPRSVVQVLIFVSEPEVDHSIRIRSIRAEGLSGPWNPERMGPDEFFPFVDTFGQYMHKSWPGKTGDVEDLKAQARRERKDLRQHPGPEQWDKYGGWKAGPQFEATGHFYPKKYRGKWWLIDPAGHLFWSHGIDCVRFRNAATPISERRHYFSWLPDRDSRFGQFYGRWNDAARGYYEGKGFRNFNFTGANLLRKFGRDWRSEAADLAHRRLRSWGMNTIGNWSASEVYLDRRTPYVAHIRFDAPSLQASEGLWKKFHDVFDPGFRRALRRDLEREKGKSAGDPWCIGHFIDNELSFGGPMSLAVTTLKCPPEQEAKKVFVEDLREKYGSIEELNSSWGTAHASWQALLECTTPPDKDKAEEDLRAFYKKMVERYYRICREEHDRVAPDNLYLGSRIHHANDVVVRAAARYCEVVSYNHYSYTASDVSLPEGVDRPVIIGEFHFGALDRGLLHTGLRSVPDQEARAAQYRTYVKQALDNPIVVGTHWFQYGDQAVTGRFDGENYQIGFVDICDRPYPETVRACRKVGYKLYRRRLEGE